MCGINLHRFILSAALVLAPAGAQAEMGAGWGGFISQGWVQTDANRLYGKSDRAGGSFDYREIGLNGYVEPSPHLRLAGQLLSRRAGEVSDGDLELDYLLAEWSPLQSFSHQAGLRIGRIKNPIGFYNDTRDVAMTRPGILLPQALYFSQVRELQISSDGMGGFYASQTPIADWRLELVAGEVSATDNTEDLFLAQSWSGRFNNSRAVVGRLLIEPGYWRFGWTEIDVNFPFEPGADDPPAPLLMDGEVSSRISILSAQYNRERWSLTGEMMRARNRWHDMGLFFVRNKSTLQSGYVQFDYRFTPNWQGFARWEELYFNAKDRDGSGFEAASGLDASGQFAQNRVVGLRWRPDAAWDLRIEFHDVDGNAWLSTSENSPTDFERHWQMLLVQAAYRF